MTMTLRIVLILASLATFMQMMRKIRESKLQIESAIFWMILAMVLVVFSVFPPVADFIAHCLGIYSEFSVPVCDFSADYEGVPDDHSHLAAGDAGQGAGTENGIRGEAERRAREAKAPGREE